MQFYKRYTDVVVFQGKNGEVKPLFVCWENGQRYSIDKIIHINNKASGVGGCGICYECLISGQVRNLFFEKEDRWFMESSKP